MKIISSFISIIHVLAFAKFNIVVGQAVGQAAVETGLVAAVNSGNKRRRSRGRLLLAADDSFESAPEFEQCQEETYDTKLYFDYGHLIFLASPKSRDSINCPIFAIDNGYMDGDDTVLAPHLSMLHEVPEGGLSLDHYVTLGSLSRVVSDLDPSDYTFPANEYNILENNCATLLLSVFEKIGLDYKEPRTNTNIVNYVGKSLAASKSAVDSIYKAYTEKNTGMFQQTKFVVWKILVGDEGMTCALVRNYMNSME
jgi:hypothetical protein